MKIKKMKIKELDKVETLEGFRETLLKLFFSDKKTRRIYVNLGEEGCEFLSVDLLNSFKDIIELSKDDKVSLTLKVDNLYFKKQVPKLNSIVKMGNIEIIDDEDKFLEIVKTPLWVQIKGNNMMFLIQNIFDVPFQP
jgi:hypothetical protein